MSLVKRIFDPNDKSIELHDVAGVGMLATHIFVAVKSVFAGIPVDLMGFGTGAGALIAAMGGAGWMRSRAPKQEPTA